MKIDNDFFFDTTAKLTVAISNSALRKYASNFDACSKLEGELPILLDTNILLGYYGMSQTEKEKLIEFLDKLQDRIILTKQVEEEFLRNRLTVIKKDFFGPLNKIAEDYGKMRSDIEGLLRNFRDNKKKILSQDYPDLFNKLQEIEEEVKATINNETFVTQVKERVEETTSNHKNIALIDGLLEKISKFKITNPLEQDEIDFLKVQYEKQVEDYKNEKEVSRWKIAVPGCGETKEDAIGDYVIYHEALKYMSENKTSLIFLTNDVTKGDWLQFDKNPHNHYIEQTYRLTEEIFYIIHAEKTLTEISFENIHNSPVEISYEIPQENEDKNKEYESTIINIDTVKGFGFIYTKEENLYFSHSDYDGEFRDLKINDVTKFQIGRNFNGQPKAINVKLVTYYFEDTTSQILKSTISHINQYRGIGFISHQPENLYFHQEKRFENILSDKNSEIQQLKLQIDSHTKQNNIISPLPSPTQTSATQTERSLKKIQNLANKIKENPNLTKAFNVINYHIQGGYTGLNDADGITTDILSFFESNDIIENKGKGMYGLTETGKKVNRELSNLKFE